MADFIRHNVIVVYPHGGTVENCFTESLVGMLAYDAANADMIADVRSAEGLYIADNRDLAARRFMRYRLCNVCRTVVSRDSDNPSTKYHCNACNADVADPAKPEWSLWLDTDVSFQTNDVLYQLMNFADAVERPVMSALYFGYMNNGATTVPVWYGRDPLDGRIVKLQKFHNGVQQLGVVGMGCCLIHRSVFETFGDRYAHTGWLYFGHDRAPWTPKSDVWNDILPFGEDNCFCHRCNELGIPIHGHGGIVVEHRKKRFENLNTFLTHIKQANVTFNGQKPETNGAALSE